MANNTNTAEREAFEAWARKEMPDLNLRRLGDSYYACATRDHFAPFLAGRASLAPSGFDAADMATASAQGFRDGVASIAASAGSEPVAPEDYVPLLDDEGRMMVGTSHHYTAENIRALVRQLRRFADPQQSTQADWDALDWRGWCNVLGRIVAALADEVPVTHPSPPEGKAGWKLVPVEPTSVMRKAAADAWLDCGSKMVLNKAAAAVAAGIAAAPPLPASEAKDTP